MLPGPTKIKKCSDCSNLIEQPTIVSGNSFGARFWTDGKMDAPMLPDEPRLVKCPNCSALIWIEEMEEVEEVMPWDKTEISISAKPFIVPMFRAYTSLLKAVEHTREKEKYLRIRAWWAGNDKRRTAATKKDLSKGEQQNLQSLVELLGISDEQDRLMKAEIKRELGQFEEAGNCLVGQFSDELADIVSLIRQLTQHRDVFVQEIIYR
jgi:hypothetical protein